LYLSLSKFLFVLLFYFFYDFNFLSLRLITVLYTFIFPFIFVGGKAYLPRKGQSFSPWQWSADHHSYAGVCLNCPHLRVMKQESMPISVILTRQGTGGGWSGHYSVNVPNGGSGRSDSLVYSEWSGRSLYSAMSELSSRSASADGYGLGGPSQMVPKKELCDRPGHCDLHPRDPTPLSPLASPTILRVRGFPPSKYIPRPFQPDVSRDSTTFVASSADSHAALSDLLCNVKSVFNTLEMCLDELDAWRLYIASGQ